MLFGQRATGCVLVLKMSFPPQTHLLSRKKPADPAVLNFTLYQTQTFTEHLQGSITSSWPFVLLFLFLHSLCPAAGLLKGTATRLRPAGPRHLRSPHFTLREENECVVATCCPSIPLTLSSGRDAPPQFGQRARQKERERGKEGRGGEERGAN